MAETRKLAAILAADVVGFSRLTGADEDRTLARLRALRSDLIDPTIAVHNGRVVKRTGDGALVEFRSVVDAVRCAIEVQNAMVERNSGLAPDRRIEFRIGIHLGDVVEENDGDLMGDGVNIAARLEGVAAPGAICLSEDAYRQVRSRLDLAISDLGETRLKNIAEPMRIYSLHVGPAARPLPRSPVAARHLAGPALPDKPSIAVLPFTNMSGDPEQEYFADGIVEDIITALSRFNQLFVIARNSSFTYKGRPVDVKQVGRDLGVRYVLEGSLRKAGNRVRITGQLIDASIGSHIWADHFDGELADIFGLQDQVTAKVVGAIAPRLEQAEIERAKLKPTESLDAYDCYLRGMAAFHLFTTVGNNEALAFFSRACELDLEFGTAYGMAARCYAQRKGFGWTTGSASEAAEARRLALRAAELGRDDAIALSAAGFTLILFGSIRDGTALVDRALTLNPNLIWAWNASALARALAGDQDAVVKHAGHSMRLNPMDPMNFGVQAIAGLGHFLAGRNGDACACAEAALHQRPNFALAAAVTAASAALSGRHADASRAMTRLRQINPALNLSNLSDWLPFQRPEDFARWAEGLSKAGLPDGN
ncbi:MAG: adenylate/guanylate cyclase domain-containing protein [Hyphomicrobiaceae bacterium]|nr:MAG: adenylate/guanylate cyclase domain-containing protein [Hyphomicrobiaceae bacterium]